MSVSGPDVFDPADLLSMGRAFDQVCEDLSCADALYARQIVASYILALASRGHRDADWLRAATLTALGAPTLRQDETVVARAAAIDVASAHWIQTAEDERQNGPRAYDVGWTAVATISVALWTLNFVALAVPFLN